MATDSQTHTFTWSGHGDTVIATGTFDDWKCSLPPLTRQADGSFSGQISLPHGDKVLYKYVVDGQWLTNPAEPIEADHSGNLNNVLHVPAMSTVLAPIAATADTVIIPTTTNTVEHVSDLPVPESAITVAGNISETPALSASSGTTSSSTVAVEEKPLTEKATETAQQVQARAGDLAQQAQAKAQEVAPQVQDKAKELATKAQETLGPAAATAGAAVVATAGAAAAGLASLTSSASQTAQDTLIDRAAPVNPVASGPIPPSSTEEKPKSPEATPLGVTGPKSHPTIPSDAAIASLAPSSASTLAPTEGGVSHSIAAAPKYDEHTAVVAKDSAPTVAAGGSGAHATAAAPKYDEHTAVVAKDSTPAVSAGVAHTTAAAPKYDEHTAVVAKDSTPVGPSTPIGAGDNAHTTTIPKSLVATSTEPTSSSEHKPVEGFIAPKENPEDAHLYHAGAAAIGAAVAGAELLGQKLVGAVHPHAVHAKEVGQQSLQDASQTGVSYLEQAKQQAEHLREQAATEAHRAVQEAEKLAREALHAAQEKAAAAQATVAGAFHHGQHQAQQTAASAQQTAQQTAASAQKQAQQTATHVQAVVTGQPAEGAPNKDITPLPASEAPVASRETTSTSSGKEAPTVPGAEITSLPASEAPVALQEGTNAMPNEANAVVPAHGTTPSTSTSSARELPNLPASEITPLPVSEAPLAEKEVSHAIAGQAQTEPAAAQASGWAQSQLSNAATTPPIGVTRTSSSYATSALKSQQEREALYAAPATVTAVPTSYATAADLGPSTQQASRDPAVLAAPAAGARSSTYTVPDRSPYEGGSLSPRASAGTGLPPPVAETKPPLTSTGSSDKALPKAPTASRSETDTYVAHAGAPSTVPPPSEPSTPSKPEESFSTAPTTPANATVVGRHGGVSEPADSASSSAPATPSPGGSDSGRDSSKKRGFFSRFLKKDKQ